MAEQYGAEMTVPDWAARLVCSRCGSRNISMVVSGAGGGRRGRLQRLRGWLWGSTISCGRWGLIRRGLVGSKRRTEAGIALPPVSG